MSGNYSLKVDTLDLMLDTTPQKGLAGAFSFQDVSPSWVQFAQGEAGYASVQPFAEEVVSSWAGSLGLYEATDAPGDTSRWFISDLDTTIPHRLASWLRYPNEGSVGTASTPLSIALAAVDAAAGQGFLAYSQASPLRYGYWRWNPVTAAFDAITSGLVLPTAVPALGGFNQRAANYDIRIKQTGASLWGGGGSTGVATAATDIASGSTTTPTNAVWHFVVIADILVGIGQTDIASAKAGLTITAFDTYDGSLASKTKKLWNGGVTVQVKVPNETTVLGVCTCEGLIYFTTDRAVYTISWQDDTERLIVNQLIDAPLQTITSAPVNHLGEVYFGMGNSVVKITPGQRGYLSIPVDAGGFMPAPFSNPVERLFSVGQSLCAVTGGQVTTSRAIWRLDAKGAWSVIRYLDNTNYGLFGNGTILTYTDATSLGASGVEFANVSVYPKSTFTRLVPIPVWTGTRNPEAFPVAYRQQVGNSHFAVSPWYYGTNRIAPKNLIHLNGEVKDVSTGKPIRLWTQYDDDDRQADTFSGATPTFPSGSVSDSPIKGFGAWTLAQQYDNNVASTAAGLTTYATNSTAVAGGNIWTDLVTANLATRTRWRFMVEIVGDTTGNTMPTFKALKFRWLEYPAKYRIWRCRIRIGVNDTLRPSGGPATEADVEAQLAALWGLKGKLVSAILPTGETKNIVVSKINMDSVEMNDNGLKGSQNSTPRIREWHGTVDLQEIIPLAGGGG